jgi:hypothetical protein
LNKLFVFLAKADQVDKPEALQGNLQKTIADWRSNSGQQIPEARFVQGSAGAYLSIFCNVDSENPEADLMNRKKAEENMHAAFKPKSDSPEELKRLTGIPIIKERIDDYLANERIPALKARCDRQIRQINSSAKEVYRVCTQQLGLPDQEEVAKNLFSEQRLRRFNEWWAGHWSKVLLELRRYTNQRRFGRLDELGSEKPDDRRTDSKDSNADHTEHMFEEKRSASGLVQDIYEELLKSHVFEMKSLSAEIMNECFSSPDKFSKQAASAKWRAVIYTDTIRLLEGLTTRLASQLEKEAGDYADAAKNVMWDSQRVTAELNTIIGDFRIEVEMGLQALILRFARPLAQLILRDPLGSQEREKLAKHYNHDIDLLGIHYPANGEKAFKQMGKYIMYGSQLFFDSTFRKQQLGDQYNTAQDINIPVRFRTGTEEANERQDVVREVFSDVNAFLQIALGSVFKAAGIEAFCEQKLLRLLERFEEIEATRKVWHSVALYDWKDEENGIARLVPSSIDDQRVHIDIARSLAKLKKIFTRNDVHLLQ